MSEEREMTFADVLRYAAADACENDGSLERKPLNRRAALGAMVRGLAVAAPRPPRARR